jgi:hypothetical protein
MIRRFIMATEITMHPGYACPHCHVLLEACQQHWQGWVLCPRCGLPGLPPEQLRARKTTHRPIARPSSPGEEPSQKIDGLLSKPAPLVRSPSAGKGRSSVSSAPLLIVSSGLFVSAFLLLIAYLDHRTQSLFLFGTLTIAFFLILVWMRFSGRD